MKPSPLGSGCGCRNGCASGSRVRGPPSNPASDTSANVGAAESTRRSWPSRLMPAQIRLPRCASSALPISSTCSSSPSGTRGNKYVPCTRGWTIPNDAQFGVYHHVTGVDASSSASLAAYINTLTYKEFGHSATTKTLEGTYWYVRKASLHVLLLTPCQLLQCLFPSRHARACALPRIRRELRRQRQG